MRLFHFTAGVFLRGIARHGLTVGDVPTDITASKGSVGVWFTKSSIARRHGLEGSIADKGRFRLAVDVPDDSRLFRWTTWAETNATATTQLALRNAGGAGFENWYIYFGRVDPGLIREVVDLSTGEPIADWQNCWPENQSLPGVRWESRFIWQERMFADVKRAQRARR